MKLVRDRIPELAGNGQRATFHQADSEEFGRLLRDKLLEEAAEAASAPGPAELLDELGDVLQVLYALASQAGHSPAEIECARARTARSAQQPRGRQAMSRAQRVLAVIVGLITGVLLWSRTAPWCTPWSANSAPPAPRSALGSWPPRLGSAPATPEPS